MKTEGVVTAIRKVRTDTFFFVQDPAGDDDPVTSDAIVVVSKSRDIKVGDSVIVVEAVLVQRRITDAFRIKSGNYLKDRDADPAKTRSKFFMANQIAVAVEEMGLSQSAAAEMTGLKQPDVSRIVNGNVKEYSVWRLMTTLKALGYDIGIEVQRLQHGNGHISLRANAEGGQAVLLAGERLVGRQEHALE